MGGIGGIVGTLGLARLMDRDTRLPLLGRTKDTLPFPIASLFVVAAVIVLFLFVRERERHPSEEERVPVLKALKTVLGDSDKSIVAIVLSGPAATALGLGRGGRLALFWILIFLYGIGWMSVVVNSFPMLWQMATYGTMGVYTGLYYTSSQTAAIVAPPVTGLIIDLGGYGGVFVFSAVCMLVAFVLMGFVRKGEPARADAGET
jgi:MFS family permease